MNGNDEQIVAAIIAAVEAYLEAERSAQTTVAPRGGVSAWRMAFCSGRTDGAVSAPTYPGGDGTKRS